MTTHSKEATIVPQDVELQRDVNSFFSNFPTQSHHKPFREFHKDSQKELIEFLHKLTKAGEVKPALKQAEDAITIEKLNPELVKLALGIFLTHNDYAQELGVVAPSLKFHRKFLGDVPKCPLSNPVTPDLMKGVHVLSYFREDYDFNDHHYHWHLVYPYTGYNDQRIIDRQGELFLYMHSQMIARYNAELLSWDLDLTHNWSYDDILTYGYTPVPGLRDDYGARPAFQGWYENHNPNLPDEQAPPPKKDLIEWRNNIFRSIESGYFVTEKQNGEAGKFELTPENAHNWVGIVVEAEIHELQQVAQGEFIDRTLYGDLHNQGHEKFAEIGYSSTNPMGVMTNNHGSPRDPCFWLWHTHIDEFRQIVTKKYTHDISQYQPQATLLSLEIKPRDPKSTTPPGGLTTFLDPPQLDIKECNAKLGHEPYQWEVTIHTTRIPTPSKDNPQVITVRLFIAPACMIEDQRSWIEMDKFTHTLTRAEDTITRMDTESSVARKPVKPGDKLPSRCLCGWPQSMMLPIGKPEGVEFVAFGMLTDDELQKDPNTHAVSFCGATSKKYPDPRGMGYPFDKTWARRVDSTDSVRQIVEKLPHTKLYNFTIYRNTRLYEGHKPDPHPSSGITWNNTIKDFFTPMDVDHMKKANIVDLSNYEDVKLHANEIYNATVNGRMPPYGDEKHWSKDKCDKFYSWMNQVPPCPEK